ncbi:periplasmic heavy metal sensor [Novosphingobium sp. FGD1]|uniref:Periplasmic heavy metal sensor n=1 Tax=Novosphingobium silvae TaxID=2692619 RepID=A0A7X4GGU8_9SPHN|nr:periplasmic heavy metal sensor [Novosphingobium silvae]MYL98352.1 periplasmic heavy metal sensor [Novosphingobium silvae]
MAGPARYVLVAVLAFLVALGALWIGQRMRSNGDGESRIHAVVHRELALDDAQRQQIGALEHSFEKRRQRLEGELRAANADLAAAIGREHAYGFAVERAVDRSHSAMGELQKATLQHIFAMRAVLRPEQTGRFDKAVAEALTSTTQG